MDIYGSDAGAISQGNARQQQVRDMNQRIKDHNDKLNDAIAGLRDQEATTNVLKQAQTTATGLWTGAGMPNKVKAYADWKASPIASNPVKNAEAALKAKPAPFGLTASKPPAAAADLGDAAEIAGKGGLGSIGKKIGKFGAGGAAGAIAATAIGGVDIYQDIKAGGIAGNNNWEKSGNLMQIGGSIADIAGIAFPPLALLGGLLDLASSAVDTVGEEEDKGTQAAALTAQQKAETDKYIAAPAPTVVASSRVQ